MNAALWPDLARFSSDFPPPARLFPTSRYSVRPVCTVFGPPYRQVVDFKAKINFKIAVRDSGTDSVWLRRESFALFYEH